MNIQTIVDCFLLDRVLLDSASVRPRIRLLATGPMLSLYLSKFSPLCLDRWCLLEDLWHTLMIS